MKIVIHGKISIAEIKKKVDGLVLRLIKKFINVDDLNGMAVFIVDDIIYYGSHDSTIKELDTCLNQRQKPPSRA